MKTQATPKEAKPYGSELYVATVYRPHNDTDGLTSHRADGGWLSFLGFTVQEALRKAVEAAVKWEEEAEDKDFGYYQVLISRADAVVTHQVYIETQAASLDALVDALPNTGKQADVN